MNGRIEGGCHFGQDKLSFRVPKTLQRGTKILISSFVWPYTGYAGCHITAGIPVKFGFAHA